MDSIFFVDFPGSIHATLTDQTLWNIFIISMKRAHKPMHVFLHNRYHFVWEPPNIINFPSFFQNKILWAAIFWLDQLNFSKTLAFSCSYFVSECCLCAEIILPNSDDCHCRFLSVLYPKQSHRLKDTDFFWSASLRSLCLSTRSFLTISLVDMIF